MRDRPRAHLEAEAVVVTEAPEIPVSRHHRPSGRSAAPPASAPAPAEMLARGAGVVGEEFRGAVQTGVHRYLARTVGRAIGYVDFGTFDRSIVYGGEGPSGPIILEAIDVVTGSIAFVVDPTLRRRGLGRTMIRAMMLHPELSEVEIFEAGVEPENGASRRCLEAAGFRLRSQEPDYEGMLYYRARRCRV